jgi:hypothetical protein
MLKITPSGKLLKNNCKVDLAAFIRDPAMDPDLIPINFPLPKLTSPVHNKYQFTAWNNQVFINIFPGREKI